MKQENSTKLNALFAFWFLVIAIVPSLIVAYFSFYQERETAIEVTGSRLSEVARIKEDQVQQLFEDQAQLLRGVALEAAVTGGQTNRDRLREILAVRSNENNLYYAVLNGNFIVAPENVDPAQLYWYPNESTPTEQFGIQNMTVYYAIPFPGVGFLVSSSNSMDLESVLYAGINDSRFFSKRYDDDQTFGIGRTADIALLDMHGSLITNPLVIPTPAGELYPNTTIQAWGSVLNGRAQSIETAVQGEGIIAHVRHVMIGNQPFALVVSISRDEALSSLSGVQRNALVLYLLMFAFVFAVLYIFVGRLRDFVVHPLQISIDGILKSTEKIRDTIHETKTSILAQEDLSTSLSSNYKNQVRDIKQMDTAIKNIVESLRSISKQTKISSRAAETVIDRAELGKKQAQDAKASVSSIKHLTMAHTLLIESLEQYRSEIESVAADVQSLSQAISYLSLNASIQAGKPDSGMRSISALVSEVGKLSLVSKEATQRINTILKNVKKQLADTKASARSEHEEAEETMATINEALESLKKMSLDTIRITNSVTEIDEQVSRQASATEAIVQQSNDITTAAKGTLSASLEVEQLVAQQKEHVKSNLLIVKKLTASMNKLRALLGK